MMNKLLIFLLISLIGILITSCPSTENGNDDPENGDPITKSISGTIHDSYSAEPVSGVSVSFGDTSTTTDGTGAFTLTITQTPVNGKLKDTFIMYGEGYQFLYIEELSIDIEKTYDIDIPISPQNFGGYTMKELTGDIFYSDGTTEISMFSSPVINIFNGIEDYNMNPLYIDSYLIDTPISGNDCLITGYADLDPNPLIFTEVGVDLSGTSPITIDITEPAPASIDTIAVNYDSAGNTAYGMYSTSYGYIPVIGRYLYNGGLGEELWVSEILNSDQSTEDVDIFNPDNWQVYWRQEELDTVFNQNNTGHEKKYICSGPIIDMASPVNLPVIDDSLGPDEPADPDSLSFSENELAQTPLSGADIYYYVASDDNTGTLLGEIVSFGESVTLPSSIQSIFEGISVRFNFTVRGYDTIEFDLDSLEDFQLIPPETKYGQLKGSGEEYMKVIDF